MRDLVSRGIPREKDAVLQECRFAPYTGIRAGGGYPLMPFRAQTEEYSWRGACLCDGHEFDRGLISNISGLLPRCSKTVMPLSG